MSNRIFSIVMAVLSLIGSADMSHAETIWEVQYTTDPGGGTYPSPKVGETVTLTGVVTAFLGVPLFLVLLRRSLSE